MFADACKRPGHDDDDDEDGKYKSCLFKDVLKMLFIFKNYVYMLVKSIL